MSRVKAQQKRLVLDQFCQDTSMGDFQDGKIKGQESSREPRYVEPG